MRRILSSLAAVAVPVSAGSTVSLGALDWRKTGDTMRVEFVFKGGRPERFRVGPARGPTELRFLVVELGGTKLDAPLLARWPAWAKSVTPVDSGRVAIRIDLDRPVPWRATWRGDVLRVDLIDRVHRKSLLTNPWVLGGSGVTLVAGGLAVWMLTGSDAPGTSVVEESDIPRPGFGLPK
jgi:hypothetical protein